jgi:predicted dehydrogenase
MNRRKFIETTSLAAGSLMLMNPSLAMASKALNRRVRVAVVGTGVRGVYMFGRDLLAGYSDYIDLVALCDINPGRLKAAAEMIGTRCALYTDLDELITQQKPDTLIVTTTDSSHHEVIIKGLQRGCNIITEKPLTIDETKAQAIIDAEKKYGKQVIVTFNYRYPPYRARIKELLMQGIIGDIQAVEFNYYLDHNHLTAYMRRWHGETKNGGSLWVHKSTHHFDMANWFIDSEPEQVYAVGSLERFGKNGPFRGESCRNCNHKTQCPYHWDITQHADLVKLYTDNEKHDGYIRDNCVFRPQIDIFDKHAAIVKYANGVQLSYILTGSSDLQGYYLAFDGTKGRLEARVGGVTDKDHIELVFIPASQFTHEKKQIFKAEHKPGGHWGGDPIMMDKLFKDPDMPDPLGQQAGVRDGVMSILIGVAARKSIASGMPVKIAGLTDLVPRRKRGVDNL